MQLFLAKTQTSPSYIGMQPASSMTVLSVSAEPREVEVQEESAQTQPTISRTSSEVPPFWRSTALAAEHTL